MQLWGWWVGVVLTKIEIRTLNEQDIICYSSEFTDFQLLTL